MRAVIRLGNGKYYCSPLFGICSKKALFSSFVPYVICLDERKERLIRQPLYDPDIHSSLSSMVLFIDEDSTDWIRQSKDYTGVDFLPQADALKYAAKGVTPENVLKRCLSYDFEEDLSVFKPVLTEDDASQFLCLTGELHDAYIKKMETRPDGSVYVLFDGAWGCRAEAIFSGDVSYNLDGRDGVNYDRFWYGSSIFLHDGYVYLADDISRVEEVPASECYFKAKSMLYRVTPE